MTTTEYVDAVSEKIHDFEIVSTSKKRKIVSKLNDILNTQNSKIDIKKTRRYRYK